MVFGVKKLRDDVFCLTEERDFFQARFLEQVSEISSLKEELKKAKREIDKLRKELMKASIGNVNVNNINLNGSTSMVSSVYCTPSKEQRLSSSNALLQNRQTKEDDDSSLTSDGAVEPPTKAAAQSSSSELATLMIQTSEEDTIEEKVHRLSNNDNDNDDDFDDDKTHDCEEDDNDSAKDIRQSAEKLLQWASYRELTSRTGSTVATDHSHSSLASPSVPKMIDPILSQGDEDQIDDNDDHFDGYMDHHDKGNEAKMAIPTPQSRAQELLNKFEDVATSS